MNMDMSLQMEKELYNSLNSFTKAEEIMKFYKKVLKRLKCNKIFHKLNKNINTISKEGELFLFKPGQIIYGDVVGSSFIISGNGYSLTQQTNYTFPATTPPTLTSNSTITSDYLGYIYVYIPNINTGTES